MKVVSVARPGVHNERRGGGNEREAPTHLIEISRLTHAARVTKNSKTARYVAKKHLVNAMFIAQLLCHTQQRIQKQLYKWSDRTTFQKSASQKTASFV